MIIIEQVFNGQNLMMRIGKYIVVHAYLRIGTFLIIRTSYPLPKKVQHDMPTLALCTIGFPAFWQCVLLKTKI